MQAADEGERKEEKAAALAHIYTHTHTDTLPFRPVSLYAPFYYDSIPFLANVSGLRFS